MKRRLYLLFLLICGCVSVDDVLNQEFSGHEVYVCTEQYNLTPGKKTIQNIEHLNSYNHYKIHMLNNGGHEETLTWIYETTDFIAETQRDLIKHPFCTKQKYEQYLENIKRQKEAKVKAARKIKENNEDCKQAKERAKRRHDELNQIAGNLMILDETITSNPQNKTSNWSFCLKVIDYGNDGIVVESQCTTSPLANMFLKSFIGCEDKNYFIYTSDAYADGECYKDWRYLHQNSGVYNWNGKRIRAYKATNYNISEIEYQTYLKDKTLQCN